MFPLVLVLSLELVLLQVAFLVLILYVTVAAPTATTVVIAITTATIIIFLLPQLYRHVVCSLLWGGKQQRCRHPGIVFAWELAAFPVWNFFEVFLCASWLRRIQ